MNREYLKFGIFCGLKHCQLIGSYSPEDFVDGCSNLSNSAIIRNDCSVIISEYRTNPDTILILEHEFQDLCKELGVEFIYEKHLVVINKKK